MLCFAVVVALLGGCTSSTQGTAQNTETGGEAGSESGGSGSQTGEGAGGSGSGSSSADTGGNESGGSSSGGLGGSETGGSETGGTDTGGAETGGASTGGNETGGTDTGGTSSGGAETGGTGGNATGGTGSVTDPQAGRVRCGKDAQQSTVECPIDGYLCCWKSTDAAFACQLDTSSCSSTSPQQTPVNIKAQLDCDGSEDCTGGKICCYTTQATGHSTSCMLPADCKDEPSSGYSTYRRQVCNPDHTVPTDCANGTCKPGNGYNGNLPASLYVCY